MFRFDPIPPTIRTLTDIERERVMRTFSGLPSTMEDCPTCRSKKTYRSWQFGEVVTVECNCRDQFVMQKFFLHIGIESMYQRLSWHDARHVETAAQALALKYAERIDSYLNAGIGLLLHGGMGTGKTLLMTLLIRKLAVAGEDVFMTTFQSLIDHYTGGWRDDERAAWFARRIRNAGVLAIDDLGRENKARIDVVEAMLDELLRSRVAGGRPTLITTNKTVEQLGQLYKSNVMSLLTESVLMHEFTGSDYREKAKNIRLEEASEGLIRPIVLS